MTPIASVEDLARVRSLPQVVIFIWVIWSGPARQAKVAVENFLGEWNQAHHPLPAFQVDLSEQQGELWNAMAEWLGKESQDSGSLMMGGAGALLWICKGKLVAEIANALIPSSRGLFGVTQNAFAGGEQT